MKNTIKRLKGKLTSQSGMTLVEVLVAMMILMIIIFTFTPLFAQYFRNVKSSGEMTRQTYEKASLIERLLSNRDSDNNGAYETYNVGVPLELYVKNSSDVTLKTLDFHTDTNANYVSGVEGNLVTTDGDKTNSGNEYTTIYLGSSSQKLVAFPKALTDDFIEKDVIVVPIGFPEALNLDKFHVYYTDEYGNWKTHEVEKGKYYTVTDASDGDVQCAKFTFYGANETICFGNSPLIITYNSHQVAIEITAPKIIMVGEKASDGNYYYYATSGVDPNTGRMDLVAKDSADLVSAMNDVEWVEKGDGDNGSGGVNDYGYYVMGGDAGQVRRFWRRGTTAKPGNYYWSGDYLYNYDSAAYYTGTSGKTSDSYETFNRSTSPVTQATFKKIVRTNQNMNTTNGVSPNTVLDYYKAGVGSLGARSWQALTSNYFTANVTSEDSGKYYLTLGKILTYASTAGWTAFRSGQDIGNTVHSNAGITADSGATANENDNLVTWITNDEKYGKTLDIDGYKAAVNYEYDGSGDTINDNSLVTITSVGAIQIGSAINKNWSTKQENSTLTNSVYPTQSYTLYCGYIPAVIDMYGRAVKGTNGTDNDVQLNGDKWQHIGTYGVATDGESWYPTGKFGDIYTTSTSLSDDIFTNLSYRTLLNYHHKSDSNFSSAYTTTTFGGELVPKTETKIKGTYTHKAKVSGSYTSNYRKNIFSSYQTKDFSNLEITITVKNQEYDQNYSSIQQLVVDAINAQPGIGSYTFRNGLNITDITESTIDGQPDPNFDSVWDVTSTKWTTGVFDAADGDLKWTSMETPYRHNEDETVYVTAPTSDGIRYFGPTDSPGYTTIDSKSVLLVDDIGTALPGQNHRSYLTNGSEVDITLGYLSHPYAIGIQNPTTTYFGSTWGGTDAGSDRIWCNDDTYSEYGEQLLSSKELWDHTFFAPGMRDNVTMLDIKSFREPLSDSTFTLAAGYTLSYLFDDYRIKNGTIADATYARSANCDQIMNTGIVYLRGTGNDTSNDTKDSMESGKGWSLGYSTNVFHQFYGIDQYYDQGNSEMRGGAQGWDTKYHRDYFNIERQANLEIIPEAAKTGSEKATTINRTPGNSNYGTYCHPLAQTECTTVNWGQTWDEKPQAMWGTANGTLLSWFYDYEEVQSGTYVNSKITGVRKEFESYIWADRYGSVVGSSTTGGHCDLSTQIISGQDSSGNSTRTFTSNGFISVLDSVNSVAYGDGYWIAVGNCSYKNPANYCEQGKDNYSESGSGTYINVKFNDGGSKYRWKAIKVSDERINFVSVEYCEGIWYAMGYYDTNGNGKDDDNELGVIFYATNPTQSSSDSSPTAYKDGGYNPNSYNGGWRQAVTRCVPEAGQKKYSVTTTVMKRNGTSFDSFTLEGVNSMASQG